jgi:hypothetical protein
VHYTLPKLGIETTFVDDPDDLDQWRAAVRPNTKAFSAGLGNGMSANRACRLAHGTACRHRNTRRRLLAVRRWARHRVH